MKNRKRILVAVFAILLAVCAGIFFWPETSDQWYRHRQKQVIAEYEKTAADTGIEKEQSILAEAEAYNRMLLKKHFSYEITEQEKRAYNSVLDITGTGVMGYIEIPKIDAALPIYHGTDEEVLQKAIGHIEGSSLPVGGTGAHTVLSGHRGLPTAKLFSDIDQLEEGDRFVIRVLNRKMTYEVDQILTVLPNETEALDIDPEKDYCTLITCTPYGVNTHRLLVRGIRVPETEQEHTEHETTTRKPAEELLFAAMLCAGIILCALLIRKSRKNRGT